MRVWLCGALGLVACGDSGGRESDSASASAGTVSAGSSSSTTATPTTSATGSASATDSATMGGSDSNGTTTSPTTGVSATGTSTGPGTDSGVSATTGTTGNNNTTGNNTTGEPPPCMPGDGMGMGMAEKSYIFIPSQDLDDVAKVNTQTLVLEARYKIGPGGESASRTAVSGDGRYVVVNNRQTGRSTMIAANQEDCVDKNGNGMIDTSQNANDVKPWGQDECVLWNIQWPYGGQWHQGPRGITWTPGEWSVDECKYINPKVWLGYMSQDGTTVHLVRVAVDGTVEETIPVPGWNGSGFSPYGGALDPQFRPWFSSLRGEFVRVNTDQNPITVDRFTPPGEVQSYGFTVDPDGNPWFGGCSGPVTVYDVMTQQYTSIVGTGACHRGVTADENFTWVASNGPCGLVQIDRKNKTLVTQHVPNPCSTAIGLSVDIEKFVWLVDQEGWAWKIDANNVPAMKQVSVPGSHYVYSDMTGGQLLSILPQ